MADVHTLPELSNLKNSKILVSVEEALFDFLVVSYEHGTKLYQGILLDASKRCLPCGISTPLGFPMPQATCSTVEEDKLYNVSQRFSYFQQKSPPHPGITGKDGLSPGSAYHLRRAMRGAHSKVKNSRMTVRLRPRQVLCSKCKSICNENSENVDLSKKRKAEETSVTSDVPLEKRSCPSRQISPKSSRAPFSENPQDNKSSSNPISTNGKKKSSPSIDSPSLHPSIIPKSVEEDAVPNNFAHNVGKLKLVEGYWMKQPSDMSRNEPEKLKRTASSRVKSNSKGQEESDSLVAPLEAAVNCSSINHSIEHSELDEDLLKNSIKPSGTGVVNAALSTILDSSDSSNHQTDSSKLNSSFVSCETDESQDRMVLRKKRNIGSMEDLWDESVFLEDTTRRTTPVIKISFGSQGEGTVLKIPSKVKNCHGSGSESDGEDPDCNQKEIQTKDASAKAAKRALKRAKKEARRKLVGGASPRSIGGSSPAYESTLYHRRHKRKVKHKKKHKEDRNKHELTPLLEEDPSKMEGSHSGVAMSGEDLNDFQSVMKDRCLKQKLSISLKRLTATAYVRCGDSGSSAGSNSPGSHSETSGADELPDFPGPPTDHSLMTVESCRTGDGRMMEVGDIVWGKIHGFPWWPGKVLSITIARREDGAPEDPRAHVAWYGSSTSSVMPCDELDPFLETFETRYNKKKRGPYKEAIRQATCEARKDSHDPLQEVDVVS